MTPTLALDLGTCTGYARAVRLDDKVYDIKTGTEEWATPTEVTAWKRSRLTRRGDPRVLRFYEWLDRTVRENAIRRIVFEDVEFCSQTYQCQLWSSLRTVVWIVAHRIPRIAVDAVPVGTLKKFATGDGGASKLGMARALAYRFPRYRVHGRQGMVKDTPTGESLDDNAVDALWLYFWAMENGK